MDGDFYVWVLGILTVAGIAAFMWPRRKPQPHGFGDRAFQRELKKELVDREIKRYQAEQSIRKEIRRQRKVAYAKQARVINSAPERKRGLDRDDVSDVFAGIAIGTLVGSLGSSSGRVDASDAAPQNDTFTPGGGSFGGGGASGSWESSSSDTSSSSSSSDSSSSSSSGGE